MENQILRIPVNGVHQKTVNRTGPTYNASLGTCEASTCVHGMCLDTTIGRYFCLCDEGFAGANCDIPKNPCISNPCGSGTCVQHGSIYRCECPSEYSGPNCDIPENSCISNPCGSGTCVQHGRTYRCECPSGYSGVQCSDVINPCSSHPCNNGSCVTNGTHLVVLRRGFHWSILRDGSSELLVSSWKMRSSGLELCLHL
ncbi:hypothetical protein OS493_032699 [Desmophyllum pertusum]|uniref:EGF-like domain-containing protein n=1 Tax=Desmophyllum pertusum TaxID=174260 RepID=A0A9X0D7B7_9CNID|nr:hypothetical protein OS493_032699 [Desmophyllum pertusum]